MVRSSPNLILPEEDWLLWLTAWSTGHSHTLQALPIEATRELLRKYSAIPR